MKESVLNFENKQLLLLLLEQNLHPSENGGRSRLLKKCLSFLTPLWEEMFVCFCIQSLLISFSQ